MQPGREIHLSFRVVIPPEIPAGGLDELIAHPRSKDTPMVRIGFGDPIDIPPAQYRYKDHVHPNERDGITYYTIDLPKSMYADFYNGMANGFFWPLNHQRLDILKMPYTSHDANGREVFDAGRFKREAQATRIVNNIFARFIAEKLAPTQNDTVVVHDYHFFGTGEALRKRDVTCPIAFFLHTPAPSNELYLQLHKAQQTYVHDALLALYSYDLVGVQAARDLRSIWSIVGDGSPQRNLDFYQPYEMARRDQYGNNDWRMRSTSISVMPVAGHDKLYATQAVDAKTDAQEFLRNKIGFSQPDIFTYGRLDYSKNGVNQAKSVGMAIQHFGLAADQVCFLHQAAYGRSDVQAYQQEYAKVRIAHSELTRRYGPSGLRSMLYTEKVARPILLALARESRVGLIVPMIDGYNLTAREYVAAQNPDRPGVLVLGKNAGVADIVNGDGALLVDAASPFEIARNISIAWNMPPHQKRAMYQKAKEQLGQHTNDNWQSALVDGARACRENRFPVRFDRRTVRGSVPPI